jgi:general secretion pathway protein M
MTPTARLAELHQLVLRWWEGRNTRERWLVAVGGLVAITLLPYVWFWEPLVDRAETLHKEVAEQRQDLRWMRKAAQRIEASGRASSAAQQPITDGRSLLGLVDRSARQAGLDEQVSRVQPDGDSSVRVWLERAPFNDLVRWLDELERPGGVRVSDLTVERTDESGLVDARLTLEVGP